MSECSRAEPCDWRYDDGMVFPQKHFGKEGPRRTHRWEVRHPEMFGVIGATKHVFLCGIHHALMMKMFEEECAQMVFEEEFTNEYLNRKPLVVRLRWTGETVQYEAGS